MDKIYKVFVTAAGAVVGYLWGVSPLLFVLLIFVVFDYVTGMLASAVEGKLSSKVGFMSIPKKIAIFIIVAMAHQLDVLLGSGNAMFRDAAIFFYLSNEVLSIVENTGRIGLPIPASITRAIEVLKGKSGDS
ncbi:phage holin family protein [Heyndrickxia faecalis]|uniref:phage holin family protein n=1 Tax=Heyndrickxia faecalis TaxID=2824910 RepID=UPI003100BED3